MLLYFFDLLSAYLWLNNGNTVEKEIIGTVPWFAKWEMFVTTDMDNKSQILIWDILTASGASLCITCKELSSKHVWKPI